MATGATPFSLSGATHVKACEAWSAKSSSFVKTPMVAIQRKSNSQGRKAAKLSIYAYRWLAASGAFCSICGKQVWQFREDEETIYFVATIFNLGLMFSPVLVVPLTEKPCDQRGGGGSGGDFVAGFLLGGAILGTLGYIFAPQIRRSLLNEDEYGFRKAKRPIYYYDEGLEKTRETLNKKLDQLNNAIDKVSSGLRGGNKMPTVPVEEDPEEVAM